jgi:hypothetical protein
VEKSPWGESRGRILFGDKVLSAEKSHWWLNPLKGMKRMMTKRLITAPWIRYKRGIDLLEDCTTGED